MTSIDSEPGKSDHDALVSPFAILQGHAHRQPASEAVWTKGAVLTYAELFDRIAACANSLLHNGLRPGEVTGVAIRDEIDNLVCAAALLCLGTPQICLASHEPPANNRAIARRLNATQVVAQGTIDWMDGITVVPAPASRDLAAGWTSDPGHGFANRRPDWIPLYRNTFGLHQHSKDLRSYFGSAAGRG